VPDWDPRVRDVVALEEEGQRRYGRGDRAGAIEKYSAGCAIVRQMVADDVPEAVSGTQLGAMLYSLGQWQLEAADLPGAIASLTEAEAAYVRLGEEPAGLVADVVIRRALVHRAAGEPLSAMADAQQAVVTAFNWGRQAGDDRAIPVARVLGLAAEVQLFTGGDPEVAVAAADWSVRAYQEMFFADGQLELPREQVFGYRCAVRSAAVVHAAFGRTQLAQPLLVNALALDNEPWPEFDDAVAHVRDFQPTLAAALRAAGGHDDLARRLDEFKETVRQGVILVPAARCRTHDAPAVARELVDAQTTLSIGVPEELLLGLEAHALFAEASRCRDPGLRDQFGEFGAIWAVAVMNFGQRMFDLDLDSAARDAARWLRDIISRLQPHAMNENSRAHGVVAAALDWLASADDALGDPG
jgi:hypothetical protein